MVTFEQFRKRVDSVIAARTDGMTADDFVDAPWRDLYEDTGGEATDEEIVETLADYDDLFADWMEHV